MKRTPMVSPLQVPPSMWTPEQVEADRIRREKEKAEWDRRQARYRDEENRMAFNFEWFDN